MSRLVLRNPKGLMMSLNGLKLDYGAIFAYILKVRDFHVESVDRYKDQKAYSYWETGFINTLCTYKPPEKYNTIFVYGSVGSSLAASVVSYGF